MTCVKLWLGFGLLAVGCRQPDRQPSVEPSAQPSPMRSSEVASSASKSAELRPPGCVVPMSESPAPAASRAESCPASPEPGPKLARGLVTFQDAPAHPQVQVELAANDGTRQRGLMYRTTLGAEEGMLFSWEVEEPRVFWMHNTCLPLDMLFVARDGTIAGVLEQVPVLNDAPRSVACPAAYVLEVNAGWVRGHGVNPGQHLAISLP